jgi:N-acetylmuramoyl-L-alanine amidase
MKEHSRSLSKPGACRFSAGEGNFARNLLRSCSVPDIFAITAAIALCVFLVLPATAADEGPLAALDYKMAGDATRARIVVHFDREPEPKWFLLRDPHRLVVDLPETTFAFDPASLEPRGLVSSVRYGLLSEGRSRLILSAAGPFEVEKLGILKNKNLTGFRLVADLKSVSEQKFEDLLVEQATKTGSTRVARKGDRLGRRQSSVHKPFTVVIDPGHGGIDGGARGVSGTSEKTITLAFANELKKSLLNSGKFRVFLTREKDEFLRLDERVRIARQHEADLFLSIHADTIRLRGVRGATVYTISEKASDALSKAIAERENLSDAIAGVPLSDEQQDVADILIDLARRETQVFSIRFARRLVDEMTGEVELINNPHRSAGFKVLRAPDVPSVLVELGYLSNAKDEALMLDASWRKKAVQSITSAVALFAATHVRNDG